MSVKNYIRLDDDGGLLFDETFLIKCKDGRKRRIDLMIYHHFGNGFDINYIIPSSGYSQGCLYNLEKNERDARRRISSLLRRLRRGVAWIEGNHVHDNTINRRRILQ